MPDVDRHAVSSWVPPARALFVVAAMLATTPTLAQQANGTLHANGRAAKLEHAIHKVARFLEPIGVIPDLEGKELIAKVESAMEGAL
mgnify:CR=1 FL=1